MIDITNEVRFTITEKTVCWNVNKHNFESKYVNEAGGNSDKLFRIKFDSFLLDAQERYHKEGE